MTTTNDQPSGQSTVDSSTAGSSGDASMTPSQVAWAKAAEEQRVRDASRAANRGMRAETVSRIIVGGLLAIAALATFFAMAPENPYDETRSSIGSSDDANNLLAEGAPQQEVVNGWTTIEYLDLLSVQQEQADDRRDALLLVGLIGGGIAFGASRLARD